MKIGGFNTRSISWHTTMALWMTFAVTVGLGIWGFICPPKGVIDASVIKYSSILFGVASLAVIREAVKEGLGIKLKHGDTEMTIDSEKD